VRARVESTNFVLVLNRAEAPADALAAAGLLVVHEDGVVGHAPLALHPIHRRWLLCRLARILVARPLRRRARASARRPNAAAAAALRAGRRPLCVRGGIGRGGGRLGALGLLRRSLLLLLRAASRRHLLSRHRLCRVAIRVVVGVGGRSALLLRRLLLLLLLLPLALGAALVGHQLDLVLVVVVGTAAHRACMCGMVRRSGGKLGRRA